MDASPLEPTPPTSESESISEITMATTSLSLDYVQFSSTACAHVFNLSLLLPPPDSSVPPQCKGKGKHRMSTSPSAVSAKRSAQGEDREKEEEEKEEEERDSARSSAKRRRREETDVTGEGFSNQESIPVYFTHMVSCHSLDRLIMAYTDYAWSTLTE